MGHPPKANGMRCHTSSAIATTPSYKSPRQASGPETATSRIEEMGVSRKEAIAIGVLDSTTEGDSVDRSVQRLSTY
jgi:hypothetical protein